MKGTEMRLHCKILTLIWLCAGRAKASATSPSMQLFGEGKIQGKGVVAIPPLGRPETPIFDGMTFMPDVQPRLLTAWPLTLRTL